MSLMTDSVHSYQRMMDKQSEQLKAVTMEKERFKRSLQEEKEVNAETVREMEAKASKLEEDCKEDYARLEGEMSDLQATHNQFVLENRNLENKYKTLSKANNAAISEVEGCKSERKKLRSQLHDSQTLKSSEVLELRSSLAQLTQGQ